MDDLCRTISNLIRTEDPKAPLTDAQIAEELAVNRSQVVAARREANIPDSRERLRPVLLAAIERLIRTRPLSDRELTELLNAEGFGVSRFTVSHLRKEMGEPAATPAAPSKPQVKVESRRASHRPAEPASTREASRQASEPDDPFAIMVGYQGSLKPCIEQAKAAILYPPHGLHTLILGPSGVGKNELAGLMYRFACSAQGKSDPFPFVSFNCADYAENPQLLLSQLFGYVRGAFTGADSSKAGLVEKADGGMLFLDEVHRLPPEGQEILFHLMDRGKFRRLGETETERAASVMLIAATTEDPESSLLFTFRRRIPMVIELPALAERPLSERAEVVRHFFQEEAVRTGTTIRLLSEAFRAFLLYDCPGNVGQLKSDIQVACARGFLAHVTEGKKEIVVDASELPNYVRRGLLKLSAHRQEIDKLSTGDLVIPPSTKVQVTEKDDLYTLPGAIYQFIEDRYAELRRSGLGDAEINRTLDAELDRQVRRHLKRVQSEPQLVTRENLIRIIGRDMVETVETMLECARDLRAQDRHLLYCLAIHMSAAVERLRQGKAIVYPHLNDVKSQYPEEFQLAREMLAYAQERLGISFPEDEAAFLAMYLRGSLSKQPTDDDRHVGLLVVTHGRVASGLVDVAGRLLGSSHVKWTEMSLDEDPETVLERATELVKDADEGKGVLLMVDMGSLLTFGEIITERTGIPTRTVSRVDITMLLEAVRRAELPGTTLDELAVALSELGEVPAGGFALGPPAKKSIVTLCLTGEGTALRLKGLLERLLGSDEVEIISLGATGSVDVTDRIAELAAHRKVAAVVGTVDPGYPDVPFIPVEELVEGGGVELVRRTLGQFDSALLGDVLVDEFLIPKASWRSRDEVLDECTRLLVDRGYVTQAFVTDVYRRELAGSTVLEGGVAIPHGDPVYVQKAAIVAASLAEPVDWGGKPVSLVCLLGLGSVGKKTFTQLHRVLQPGPQLERLKAATTRWEMKRAIFEGIKVK